MRKFLFLLLLAPFYGVNSQSVKGTVEDESGYPIPAATITISLSNDSLARQFTVSNDAGKFSFTVKTAGNYILCATGIGYAKHCALPLPIAAGSRSEIMLTLEKQPISMNGVTVAAQKPLIEVRADRLVVNVEGTINSVGTTAMEVLRKAPGINIDNEDNLSLNGKNGVQVYIDGRLSPLSGTDLSSFLYSLQSAQLESSEIRGSGKRRYHQPAPEKK